MANEAAVLTPRLIDRVQGLRLPENRLVRAIVPFEMINGEDVPVDEDHVITLAKNISEEATNSGRPIIDGQLQDILLAEIPGEERFRIADGFHRHDAMHLLDAPGVKASIRPDCTLDYLSTLRIVCAVTHQSVKFARLIGWVEDIWSRSPWADRIKVSQAFSLQFNPKMTGIRMGLTTDEVVEIKDWVVRNSKAWTLSPQYVYHHLQTAQVADPELVKEARERPSGHKLEALTPMHLAAIARTLPNDYPMQRVVAEAIKRMNLTVPIARAVARAVTQATTIEQAQEIIAAGKWRPAEKPTVVTATAITRADIEAARNIAEKMIDPLLEAEMTVGLLLLERAISQGTPISPLHINGDRQTLSSITNFLPHIPARARRVAVLNQVFGLPVQAIAQMLQMNPRDLDDMTHTIDEHLREKATQAGPVINVVDFSKLPPAQPPASPKSNGDDHQKLPPSPAAVKEPERNQPRTASLDTNGHAPTSQTESLLAERMLGHGKTLQILLTDGETKSKLLEQIATELGDDPEGQICFLRSIIGNIAKEGDLTITNRRDGAVAILVDEAMALLVKAHIDTVLDTYLAAVRQQTRANDAFAGSVDALLEVGKAIAPYIRGKQRRNQVANTWEEVTERFLTVDERIYIREKLAPIIYPSSYMAKRHG